MSKVDRGARNPTRVRRMWQKLAEDPEEVVGDSTSIQTGAFFGGVGTGATQQAASGALLRARELVALFGGSHAPHKYNDTALRSRSWMGI